MEIYSLHTSENTMNKPVEFVVQHTTSDNTTLILTACDESNANPFKQDDIVLVSPGQPQPKSYNLFNEAERAAWIAEDPDNIKPKSTLYRDTVEILAHMSEGPFSVDKVFHEGPALIDGDADFVCRLPIVINATHDASIRAGKAECTQLERDMLKKVDANTAILMNAHRSFYLLNQVAFNMPPDDPVKCADMINTIRNHLTNVVKDWHHV